MKYFCCHLQSNTAQQWVVVAHPDWKTAEAAFWDKYLNPRNHELQELFNNKTLPHSDETKVMYARAALAVQSTWFTLRGRKPGSSPVFNKQMRLFKQTYSATTPQDTLVWIEHRDAVYLHALQQTPGATLYIPGQLPGLEQSETVSTLAGLLLRPRHTA